MTSEVVTVEGAAARTITAVDRPYAPSWADAIVRRLEQLPGPTWLAYLGLVLVGVVLVLLEGATHRLGLGGLRPDYFAYVFFYVFPLAAYHYLSAGARAAWLAFRPATDLTDAAADRIGLELSTTPYRPVAAIWVVTAVANTLSAILAPEYNDLANQPPAYVALRIISESLWVAPIFVVVLYLVVRQMRLVARLHRSVKQVDLLRPGPLHAMSTLTARSAIALAVIAVASGLPLPGISESGWLFTVVVFCLPLLVVAAAAFVVPLRGMNQRLAAEKSRQLGEISDRYALASATLHRLVDEESVAVRDADASRLTQTRIDALNKAIATLLAERDFIRRQSTWPWDGATFRAVASAIALPVALFLITRLLDRLVF